MMLTVVDTPPLDLSGVEGAQVRVPAGYPSPAQDYQTERIDLTRELIGDPAATFYVRVSGDSMTGASIQDGDLLIVDRSARPVDGSVVVAAIDGEGWTVKRLRIRPGGGVELRAENPAYPAIALREQTELVILGVVTVVIHRLG